MQFGLEHGAQGDPAIRANLPRETLQPVEGPDQGRLFRSFCTSSDTAEKARLHAAHCTVSESTRISVAGVWTCSQCGQVQVGVGGSGLRFRDGAPLCCTARCLRASVPASSLSGAPVASLFKLDTGQLKSRLSAAQPHPPTFSGGTRAMKHKEDSPMTTLRVAVLSLACFFLLSISVPAQSGPFTIGIRDACDPGTFSSPIKTAGPLICRPGQHGRTKFKLFIAELQSDHIAGAWRFNPLLNATTGTFQLATVSLNPGQATALQNTGGELHTFTKVATFGGGFIPPLNQLSGNPVPAPECLQPENAANIFVEAGTTETGPAAGSAQLPAGVTNWQCCVHPWMRMRIEVH